MKKAVKIALLNRNRTMTNLAESIGKDRAALTESLYNGNTVFKTIELVALELDYQVSEFIKLGEG